MVRRLNSNANEGYILTSSLNSYYENLTSEQYSIKIPIEGSEHYTIDGQAYSVSDAHFIITNPKQEVIAEVESKEKVKGLCIYISQDIMKDVFFSSAQLFTEDDHPNNALPLILAHSYAANFDELGGFINSVKHQLINMKTLDGNTFFYQLCELMLKKRRDVHFQFAKIEAIKRSTRKELYRRLDTMHQIIKTCFKDNLSISKLAKMVGISKFHAIRQYRNVYNCTPYQHIQQLRLEASKNLLKNHTITETSHLLNFSDRNAFSKAFKKQFGCSPSAYLNQADKN